MLQKDIKFPSLPFMPHMDLDFGNREELGV